MPARGTYFPLVKKFFENDPVAAAQSLETMDDAEAVKVLRSLPPSLVKQAFRYLQTTHAVELLHDLEPSVFAEIIEKVEPRQGAVIFSAFSNENRQRMIDHLPTRLRNLIREQLTYPENSAGRIMSLDVIAFHEQTRVRDVIRKLRALAKRSYPASYVYVVDSDNRLAGIVNMRDLLVTNGSEQLSSVTVREVFAIDAFMDREDIANEMSRLRYFAAPVIDGDRRLLGVVNSNRLISDVQAEATEDIQKMFGAGGNERVFSPVFFSLRKRLPWLHVNLATAFLAAAVVGLFESVIAKITVLAVFLPVVAGQGGNAGSQSLAIVMRGLVMREIPREKVWGLIVKETWIGCLNGIVIGMVTSIIAWIWVGNPFLGLVIGLAMIVNLLVAGFAGSIIPITMKALGLDPAQSSGIVLTTITDVIGFFSFLGFAMLFQSYLM